MGFKNFLKKSVARISAVAMALTMFAMPASPVFAEGQNDNLFLSKGIELQSDGNYKIKLEAYATGTDTTTTTTESVPLDIVLVLDQSGSMADPMNYEALPSSGYSYNSYGDNEYYYKYEDDYYKVKRHVYGGKYYLYFEYGRNSYAFLSGTDVFYNQWPNNAPSNVNTNIYTGVLYKKVTRLQALKSAVTNFVDTVKADATTNSVNHRISIVGFADNNENYGYNTEILSIFGTNSGSVGVRYGKATEDTYKNSLQDVSTTAGQTMLTNAINALAANGATRTDYGMEMASKVLAKATNTGDYNQSNRKKLVIMFTDGTPTTQSDFSSTVANSAISYSKTMKAKGEDALNASVYSIGIFSGADPSSLASNENKFMNYVSSNYPNAVSMTSAGTGSYTSGYYKSASDASELSIVFESISNEVTSSGTTVTLDENAVLKDVLTDKFDLASATVSAYTVNGTADATGVITWGAKAGDIAASNITVDGKNINVKGFDYSNEYITANHSGKKLVVEILVNGAVDVSGMDLYSNTEASGIYAADGTFVKPFVNPTVNIPEYSYVLDYGKEVTIPNTDRDYDVSMMHSTKAAPATAVSIAKAYGTFTLANNTLNYKPGKINWNGFDSVFAFGQKTDNTYEWSKTNVIPATSVYYEDDFGAENNGDSNIAIVWTGSWVKDGTSQDEKQSSANENYGWEESYTDDTGYSNGSAHKTNLEAGTFATAKFTFTGTGVDVYSRTNGDVGMIVGDIYDESSEKRIAIDSKYIDNISVSGDYYQIPTLSFSGLEYGTYTVEITAGAKGKSGKTTYYLDGIRVYNPLKDNAKADEAYKKADEASAVYKQVRESLLKDGFDTTNTEAVKGVVFIDKITGEDGNTTNQVSVYEDYGPKNEVYLAAGQSIAFNIAGYSDANKVAVGIKAPAGASRVSYSNGANRTESDVTAASDLYYTVVPTSDGNVVIENKGQNLIAITKVKLSVKNNQTASATNYTFRATPALMSYVNEFDSLPVVALEEPAVEEEQPPVVEEPQEEPNTGDENLGEGDVDIENPDEQEQQPNQKESLFEKIKKAFKKWFRF